ncbi:MAG: glycosyltransferase [Lachnospiraceae bacterium]|nr:glycosyltransferase [Lachnospiraceae bacterium]
MNRNRTDLKIAESEAEWRRYHHENAGVRESAGLFFGAIKRSAVKRAGGMVKTVITSVKRAAFQPSYGDNRENIVVSLTSTGDRIRYIFPTLYSLAVQTRKPDLIVLWLGKNMNYPKRTIDEIRALGIKVRFREDLGPNTKYYHAFGEYKNDLVVTVDDDIVYHKEMVEELYGTYLKHPDSVIARRVNLMRFDRSKELLSYRDWIWEYRDADGPSLVLLATGVGGVLYPPAVLAFDCWKNRDFRSVCPSCDDIWLKFCQLSKGIKVCPVTGSKYPEDVINFLSQKTSLSAENVDKGGNDEGIRACTEYFGMRDDLCERVLTDD